MPKSLPSESRPTTFVFLAVPGEQEKRRRRKKILVMQWSLQDVLFLNWNLLRLTNAGTLSSISGL